MSTVNNIPTGLLVPAQVPLDAKLYIANEASLMNLGTANNLAYTYYEGMIVYCVAEKRRYEWREGTVGEVGLLPSGFTYPSPLVINGITYSGRTFNFFIVLQNVNITNVGSGVAYYKGFNIPANAHQFRTFTSTGLNITTSLSNNEVNIETNPGLNLGTGVEAYIGVNATTKLHEYRTFKSVNAGLIINQVGNEIQFNSTFYNTVVQAGSGIIVTGTGTALNPYVVSLAPVTSPWLRGDTKEVVCDSTYLANNFIASGDTEGLGINERAGWAIMNGNNGTPPDDGRVVIAWGASYPVLNATGGSADAVLVAHDHNSTIDADNNVFVAKNPAAVDAWNLSTASASAYLNGHVAYNSKTSIAGGTETGVGKNMQPYVVRLRIMKL